VAEIVTVDVFRWCVGRVICSETTVLLVVCASSVLMSSLASMHSPLGRQIPGALHRSAGAVEGYPAVRPPRHRQDAAGQGGGHPVRDDVLQRERLEHHQQVEGGLGEADAGECHSGSARTGLLFLLWIDAARRLFLADYRRVVYLGSSKLAGTTALFSAANPCKPQTHLIPHPLKVLFELARHHAPSTIFLDEVDALMGARGAEGERVGG